ncbi:MAG TPA: cation transporter [Burkholderiales bacterium]|nr:cation transporter [Burkholderiales bacterium]
MEALRESQGATLRVVLAINAVLFVVELAAGVLAGSTALLSDSLDNLGDALTYGLSIYAISRGPRTKAKVALLKGFLILAAALFVLAQVGYRALYGATPLYEAMGVVSLLALAGNATCLALLWKHRSADVNMSSVWECSRNDIAGNVAVFIAAGAVWLTGTRWPDLVVGLLLSAWLLASSARVLRNGAAELKLVSV